MINVLPPPSALLRLLLLLLRLLLVLFLHLLPLLLLLLPLLLSSNSCSCSFCCSSLTYANAGQREKTVKQEAG